MAARLRAPTPGMREHSFGMRSLSRLAIWGTSASIALALAVAASYSESGSRRIMLAMTPLAPPSPAQKGDALATQVVRPSRDSQPDLPPIAETMRALAAEREGLAARISRIEQHLEDLTGTIVRQEGISNPSGLTPALPSGGAGPATAPARSPREEAPPRPASMTAAELQSSSKPNPVSAASEPSGAVSDKAEFGADVGAAPSLSALRALWTSLKNRNAGRLEGLRPLIAVRQNRKTKRAELRLVIGPLANPEGVGRLCATLATVGRSCESVEFEGEEFGKVEQPGRRPAAARPQASPSTPPGRGLFMQ
jgi:hypothetical protein